MGAQPVAGVIAVTASWVRLGVDAGVVFPVAGDSVTVPLTWTQEPIAGMSRFFLPTQTKRPSDELRAGSQVPPLPGVWIVKPSRVEASPSSLLG